MRIGCNTLQSGDRVRCYPVIGTHIPYLRLLLECLDESHRDSFSAVVDEVPIYLKKSERTSTKHLCSSMEQRQPERELQQIQDLDAWLEVNGLASASNDMQESTVDQVEEQIRIQQDNKYQESVHRSIFADQDKQEQDKQELLACHRKKQIESMSGETIVIATEDQELKGVPLPLLAESCDLIYTMATNRHLYSDQENKTSLSREATPMIVSLARFSSTSVRDFLSLLKQEERSYSTLSSDGAIADCCQIAHYLQHTAIIEETAAILSDNITTENCYSLCELADQLSLSSLLEKSLRIVLQSLDSITDQKETLSPELLERIQLIQRAIQSSVHNRPSSVYFSSLDEYLAIFAERVQYYRERLADAKEDYERNCYSNNMRVRNRLSSQCQSDMERKIQQQEQRLRTLEAVWKEQKKLFARQLLRK